MERNMERMEATPDPRLDADVAAMLARQAAADVRRWIACVGLVAKRIGPTSAAEREMLYGRYAARYEAAFNASATQGASLADEVEAELAAWPEQVAGG